MIRVILVISIPNLKLDTSAIMPISHGKSILDMENFKNNMEETAPEFCGYHPQPMVISSGIKAPDSNPDNPAVMINTMGELVNRPRVRTIPPASPPHIISFFGEKRWVSFEQANLPSIIPIQKTERPIPESKGVDLREVSM